MNGGREGSGCHGQRVKEVSEGEGHGQGGEGEVMMRGHGHERGRLLREARRGVEKRSGKIERREEEEGAEEGRLGVE